MHRRTTADVHGSETSGLRHDAALQPRRAAPFDRTWPKAVDRAIGPVHQSRFISKAGRIQSASLPLPETLLHYLPLTHRTPDGFYVFCGLGVVSCDRVIVLGARVGVERTGCARVRWCSGKRACTARRAWQR
jgi:hypothetical protein